MRPILFLATADPEASLVFFRDRDGNLLSLTQAPQ